MKRGQLFYFFLFRHNVIYPHLLLRHTSLPRFRRFASQLYYTRSPLSFSHVSLSLIFLLEKGYTKQKPPLPPPFGAAVLYTLWQCLFFSLVNCRSRTLSAVSYTYMRLSPPPPSLSRECYMSSARSAQQKRQISHTQGLFHVYVQTHHIPQQQLYIFF